MSQLDFESVKKVFDERSMYSAVVEAGYMHHGLLAAWLAAWAAKRTAPLVIVDLGCGDAWLAAEGFGEARVESYLGVDVSEASLERGKGRLERWRGRTKLMAGELAGTLAALPDESANVVLASYSIHHLPSDGKAAVLVDCRRVLEPGGTLFWIDVFRREGEDRAGTIGRLTGAIQRDWTALSLDERDRACAHIRESDFPETLSWMRERAEGAGLEFTGMMFEGEFFTGLTMVRPAT